MSIAQTSRSATLFLTSVLTVAVAACAGAGSGGTGAGGGNGGAGSGGAAGSAGASGPAGNGGAGSGGHDAGSSGAVGAAGSTADGAAGSGGGFVPYVCPAGVTSPTSFPAGATATRIDGAPPSDAFNGQGNNFESLEGPVWITDALYVSEYGSMTPNPPPSRILKIDESDAVTIAFPTIADTGTNGLAVDGNGDIVSANHGIGGIVAFTLPSGTPMTTLTSMYMGARFDSPNDLTIRSDGIIYFTDFCCFQTPTVPPNNTNPQTAERVYMLTPGSSNATALFTDTSGPNGITLSLDQKTLYVGDGGGVKAYAVNTDGTIAATGTAFDAADLGNQNTDGMAIDCAGDLYVVRVSDHHIIVANPSGTTIGDITGMPNSPGVTNVAFGGADHKTLYVTAQGTGTARGVFKLALPVPGMPY